MNVLNKYEEISINNLMVNPANDRHGEMEDEIDAMNWLLSDSPAKIKTLAKDIAEKGYVFAAPLVSSVEGGWLLHDGNRRVTCLKMLNNPSLANDTVWQRFFEKLARDHTDNIPTKLVCRIEEEQQVIDDIVYRLHAGGESGVGTVEWNPRQKQNHAIRTGKQSVPSLGIQIEQFMKERGLISEKESLPIRNIERLLSSGNYQGKVGIAYQKGEPFRFIIPEAHALVLLKRVCDDLMSKKITIDGLIKNAQKDEYFKGLEKDGLVSADNDGSPPPSEPKEEPPQTEEKKKRRKVFKTRYSLIDPNTIFTFGDEGELIRVKAIIEELKSLTLKRHINAVSVLFRVLIEAATNYYNDVHNIHFKSDKIHVTVSAALDHMVQNKALFGKDADTLKKFSQNEEIISANTFHAYVHSHTTTPSEQHLCSMWDTFTVYVQNCLKAEKSKKKSAQAA